MLTTHPPQTADRDHDSDTRFQLAAEEILALDCRVRFVAYEVLGHPVRWASKDSADGGLLVERGGRPGELIDPAILLLAEERDMPANRLWSSHPLKFMVMVYDDLTQVAARCGPGAFVYAAVDSSADAHAMAWRISSIVSRVMLAAASRPN
jgi:hypothetical protein